MTKGRRSGGKRGGGAVVPSVSSHFFATAALSGGTTTFPIVPSGFGSSVISVSDGYSLFRVKKLKFRIFAFSAGASVACVTSTTPNPPVTRPTVMECLDGVDHEAGAELTWSRWVNVRKPTIRGMLPWYKTRAGSFDATEYTPCFLAFAGTGSNIVNIEIFTTWEFKDPISTASTPLEAMVSADLRLLREYDDRCELRQRTLMSLSGVTRMEDVDPRVLAQYPPPNPPRFAVIDYDACIKQRYIRAPNVSGFLLGARLNSISEASTEDSGSLKPVPTLPAAALGPLGRP